MLTVYKFLFYACGFSTAAVAAAYALTFTGATFHAVLLLFPLVIVAWPLILWHWRKVPMRSSTSALFGSLPRGIKAAAVIAFGLATANFLLCGWLNDFGRPVRLEDGYALKAGATVTRSLTAAEYQRARAIELRLITGHLVLIFALTAYLARATWIQAGGAGLEILNPKRANPK